MVSAHLLHDYLKRNGVKLSLIHRQSRGECLRSDADFKTILAQIFDIKFNKDNIEETSESIFIDIQNGVVKSLLQSGVGIKEIPGLLLLQLRILLSSKGKSLSQTVVSTNKLLQDCNGTNQYTERGLSVLANHLFTNFFQHFHLYHVCLFSTRDRLDFQTVLNVETPQCNDFKLNDAKSENVWKYYEKLKTIENEEETARNNLRVKYENITDECYEKKREFHQRMMGTSQPLTKETVSDLIKDAVATAVAESKINVNKLIDESSEEVSYMIAKTCLPRPQILGPPTRYTPKSAVKIQKRSSAKKSAPPTASRTSRSSGRKSKG